ncbi:MAG TPA: ABC transporter permease [Streptosporangiaceae bacterium]|jgi:ABC-type dipeptide/oligopeptide/nickel transport system permease component
MGFYVSRRLLVGLPTLLGVATVSFLLLRLIPGDPAKLMAGPTATPAQVEHLRVQFGLTGSEISQYFRYLGNLLHGNLGISTLTGQAVSSEIATAFPYTLELAVAGIILALAVGVPLGIAAALRRGGLVDTALSGVSVIGVSMPVYWSGLLLIILFAAKLKLLPAAGAESPDSIILPAVTLSLFAIGFISRQTRSAMIEALSQDYTRTARAKGMPRRVVVLKHALRNAAVPIVTVAGLQFGQLLGGAVLTETIFGWPGLGNMLVQSINARDYATVQGAVLLFAVAVLVVNLATDILYATIDPRVRYD